MAPIDTASAPDMRGIENIEDPQMKERAFEKQCDVFREKLERTLHSAVQEGGMLKAQDVKDYMNPLKDEEMRKGGAQDYKTQWEWLQIHPKLIDKMVQESREFSAKYKEAITKAKKEGALNDANEKHLQDVLRKRKGNWEQVKAFFTQNDRKDSLLSWSKNWAKLAEQKRKVDALQKRLKLSNNALPELAALRGADKTGKVVDRLKLLDAALDALTRYEQKDSTLYKEAEKQLRYVSSVNPAMMPSAKVGRFLAKTMEKYKGERLEEYVRLTLPTRVNDWLKEGKNFQTEREKAKKRGANAVSEEAYFSMSYAERRTAFTQLQSENRKAETQHSHPLLSQAQKLIDDDAWDKAEKLLQRAEFGTLTEKDQRRIFDLRQQIRMERGTSATLAKGQGKEGKETPMQKVQEKRKDLRDALLKQPESLRLYYKWALEAGGPLKWLRMRRLRVWHYNVAWAHRHGFMNNEEEFMKLKKDSEKDTARINETGHSAKGVERINVGQASEGVEGSNRKFEGGQSRGATWHVFGKDSLDEMRKCVDYELDNERKTYWGLTAPEGVTLKQMLDSFELLNPKIKALQNAEQAAGGLVSQEAMHLGDGASSTHIMAAKA